MKKIIYILIALLVLVGLFFAFNAYVYNEKQGDDAPGILTSNVDPKNATYFIDGTAVALVDGVSERPIPNSSAKVVTRYFGNETTTDLNADGRDDVFFLLTQETGGSGTFYYAVGALNTDNGYMGTEGVLLGDRIAPQNTQKGEGSIVVVNYADRKPGEDFSVAPSVGKSMWLKLDPATLQFGEVAQNFEGEADPKKMSLTMQTWNWIEVTDARGVKTTPKRADVFKLTFKTDGSFSLSTDCNGIGGNYTATGGKISFDQMISTMMYCEGSQEDVARSILEQASAYTFTSKGELVFTLKTGGKAVFR